MEVRAVGVICHAGSLCNLARSYDSRGRIRHCRTPTLVPSVFDLSRLTWLSSDEEPKQAQADSDLMTREDYDPACGF